MKEGTETQAGRTEGLPWGMRETSAGPGQVCGNFGPYAELMSPVRQTQGSPETGSTLPEAIAMPLCSQQPGSCPSPPWVHQKLQGMWGTQGTQTPGPQACTLHSEDSREAWETTYIFGSVVHLPLSGRRWQGREEDVRGEPAVEWGTGRRQCPGTPATPAMPAHLGICQHDVLDARWPAGLGAFHAHIVDLVAADLPVLPAGRGRAPQHSDGRGVERLRLHLPRGRAGHWRAGGGRRGCYQGARPCPGPRCWAALAREGMAASNPLVPGTSCSTT